MLAEPILQLCLLAFSGLLRLRFALEFESLDLTLSAPRLKGSRSVDRETGENSDQKNHPSNPLSPLRLHSLSLDSTRWQGPALRASSGLPVLREPFPDLCRALIRAASRLQSTLPAGGMARGRSPLPTPLKGARLLELRSLPRGAAARAEELAHLYARQPGSGSVAGGSDTSRFPATGGACVGQTWGKMLGSPCAARVSREGAD
jgi:hypothetical protein